MVTGSRHWRDARQIRRRLAELDRSVVIVHGACPFGADAMADRAAHELGLAVERYPAHWRRGGHYNPLAGLYRNNQMLDSEPRLARVIAFRAPGKSNGTDHAIQGARLRGIAVELHHEGGTP
jgi:hypothetical protein